MNPPKTIGFPRMRNEVGEKRVFLPEFIQYLANHGMEVYIEEGYGARSGYTYEDYKRASLNMQPRAGLPKGCVHHPAQS
jgi:alanine dehydrogenase